MARLRQCLTGSALEAIRGLGVTVHEYEEAKEIFKTNYGGAYLDQLEQAPLIRSNDIHALEKFVGLIRITVVKLQAERRDGELEDGTLHSLLVKKLTNRQLENYSRWLNERARQKSVIAFRDWLKDEVIFQIEAAEMANGIELKPVDHVRPPRVPRVPSYQEQSRMRNFHTAAIGKSQKVWSLHVLSATVSITGCGFARSFMTEEWMTAGRSLKKKSCVLVA